jgi:UDP-glucose:(heptosyl)LPS alpha-1,3-glucosyltransferase
MRLAIIKSNYTPFGGAEKYTTRLVKAFADLGIEVDLLAAGHGEWGDCPQNVRTIELSQFRYNNLLRTLSFNSSVRAYLRKQHYDCILGLDRTDYQTHLRLGGGCHASWLARRSVESTPFRRLSFRLNPFHIATVNLEKRALREKRLKTIFCNSNMVRNEIAHYYPESSSKAVVVHNGVQWNEFELAFNQRAEQRESILKNFNLDQDKFFFLFTGSGYERKGLLKAIKAMPLLPSHTELLVVGKDKDEGWYKEFCNKIGLAGRVHFFGPQRDIIPFLQIADAFVLPTLYDPFSNASIEALAMGLFTITSKANGCSEVIRDGDGFIIEDLQDIDSVAEAMRGALGQHADKETIRKSVSNLDFEIQLKKIVDVCIEDTSGN